MLSRSTDPYYRLRHSAAHVLAQAALSLFPEGKLAIGSPVEDGFYDDFDLPRPLTPDDLRALSRYATRWAASGS